MCKVLRWVVVMLTTGLLAVCVGLGLGFLGTLVAGCHGYGIE